VIAGALDVLGDEEKMRRKPDRAGIFHHVSQEFAEQAVVGLVDLAVLARQGRVARILFYATIDDVGFRALSVSSNTTSLVTPFKLTATAHGLESRRYTVRIDAGGDISSIYDRETARELLRAPIRLEMRDDPSPDKPAWRILYNTINAPVREYPVNPEIKVVEDGPWRATVEITRHAAGSTIVQRVSLTEEGDRVDVETVVDWKSPNTLLKAAFPFTASNPRATYDLGLGTIQRGNNTEKAYEVPAQKWADITDASGSFGAAVLNDSKYGWDKPADNILRLTLLHTPLPRAYPYQSSNDLGHHRFTYSIAGHRGDWRDGQVPQRAAELNQPLIAFQTSAHSGALGRSLSLASLTDTTGQIAIRAIKKAEDSEEYVVRLQEQYGRAGKTTLKMAGTVVAVREVNAAEESVGPLSVTDGAVVLDGNGARIKKTAAVVQFKLAGRATVLASRDILESVIDLRRNRPGWHRFR
jgi:alpha-mannosidase